MSALAADVQVVGKIIDQKNNPVPQSTIIFSDSKGKPVQAVRADIEGNYRISLPEGSYSIVANGPQGTKLKSEALKERKIVTSSTINFTLTAPDIVVAQKPPFIKTSAPYIVSVLLLVILVVIGLRVWKRNKLTQTGSSH